MITRKELIAALDEAENRARENSRWEYDTIRNAEVNGACMALEYLRLALIERDKEEP